MNHGDIYEVTTKLKNFMTQFDIHRVFDLQDVEYWLMPREKLIYSYVVEDPTSKEITDFISFTSVPYIALKNNENITENQQIYNAFCYYYFVSDRSRLVSLLQDALILAKKVGFATFNCFDQMHYRAALDELNFQKAEGYMNYHAFKQRIQNLTNENLGILFL